ncbi:unnamed protein product [Closterium sp. NIES-53]
MCQLFLVLAKSQVAMHFVISMERWTSSLLCRLLLCVTVFTAYGASATSLIATLPDGGSSAASAASAKPLLYKGKTFSKFPSAPEDGRRFEANVPVSVRSVDCRRVHIRLVLMCAAADLCGTTDDMPTTDDIMCFAVDVPSSHLWEFQHSLPQLPGPSPFILLAQNQQLSTSRFPIPPMIPFPVKYVAKMKPTKRNGKIVGDKGASGIASVKERLNEQLQQLRKSSEEIAALTAKRTSLQNDVARAQQAQSQAPGTPGQPAPQTSQHGSVGKPASAANDGVVRNDEDDDHSSTHPEETNAAKSQPRVTISVPAGESTLPSPVALKPQRPPCFDSSQRGGPTVQAWLFTLNVFFDANYVSEDTAKIRYAVSLLRGPAMDWWRVIVTKPVDYATLSTREGQTGPWAPSYFMEVPQYRTWDTWCAGLRAQIEPITASIAAR